MKIEYSKVKPGQSFRHGKLEFTKLNDTMSIIDTIDRDISFCIFDNFDNDYEKSLIRNYINNRYCDLVRIDKTELQPINDLGDKLQLLSLEEFKDFKNYISLVDCCCWLRSPYPGFPYNAFLVNGIGACSNADVGLTLVLRPALIFKPSVIVEVEHE